MTRLLLMEGNTRERRERSAALGLRSGSEVYAAAIGTHFPEIATDVICAADKGAVIPNGRDFADYDGFVVCGSALYANDREFEVANQIETLNQAAAAGLPVLASCWGLQIATVAAGGEVAFHPGGSEIGFARKIAVNAAGRAHPMFANRSVVFDAPCIHYDEVARLPAGATLLASNDHSRVQAAIIPLGNSEVWGMQYHPEYDFAHLVTLHRMLGKDLIAQGLFADEEELLAYCDSLTALARNPADTKLAAQLGIDVEVTDPRRRHAEIIAWVASCILG
jgi:GMP synthase (glutamine-hydrolysing)